MGSFAERLARKRGEAVETRPEVGVSSFAERLAARREDTTSPSANVRSYLYGEGHEWIAGEHYYPGQIESLAKNWSEFNKAYRTNQSFRDAVNAEHGKQVSIPALAEFKKKEGIPADEELTALQWKKWQSERPGDTSEILDAMFRRPAGAIHGRKAEEDVSRDLTPDEMRGFLARGTGHQDGWFTKGVQDASHVLGTIYEATPINWMVRGADAALQNMGVTPERFGRKPSVKLNVLDYAMGAQDESGESIPDEERRKLFGFWPQPEGRGILETLNVGHGPMNPLAEIAAFGVVGGGIKGVKASPLLTHLKMKLSTPMLRYGLDNVPLPAEQVVLQMLQPSRVEKLAAAQAFKNVPKARIGRKQLPAPRAIPRFVADKAGALHDVPAEVAAGRILRTPKDFVEQVKAARERKALPPPRKDSRFVADEAGAIHDFPSEVAATGRILRTPKDLVEQVKAARERKQLPPPRQEPRFASDKGGAIHDLPAEVAAAGRIVRTPKDLVEKFKAARERKKLPVPRQDPAFIGTKEGLKDLKREAAREAEFMEKGYDISTQDLGVAEMLAKEHYAASVKNALQMAGRGRVAAQEAATLSKMNAVRAMTAQAVREAKAFMERVEQGKVKPRDKGMGKRSQIERAAGELGALDISVIFDAMKTFGRISEKLVKVPLKIQRVAEDVALFPFRYAVRGPVQAMITKGLELPVAGPMLRSIMPKSSRVGQVGIDALDAIRAQNEFNLSQRQAAMWGKGLRHTFRGKGFDIPTGLKTRWWDGTFKATLKTDKNALRSAFEYARAITYGDFVGKSRWRRSLTKEQRTHVENTMREVRWLNEQLAREGLRRESTLLEYPEGLLRDIYPSGKRSSSNRPSRRMRKIQEHFRADKHTVTLKMNEEIALKYADAETVVNSGSRGGETFIKFTDRASREAFIGRLREEGLTGAAKPQRVEPVTPEGRKEAGLIDDYRLAGEETLSMLRGQLAIAKWQKRVAREPNLVSAEKSPRHTHQMPVDNKYGPLSGKWVNDMVHDSVMTTHGAANFLVETMAALRSPWKQAKVTLEPRAHARQLFGNILASPLSGASPLNPFNWPYYLMAASDIMTKNPRWRESVRRGVSNADFTAEELGFIRHLARERPEGIGKAFVWYLNRVSRNPVSKRVGEVYGWGDSVFRHAHYLKLTRALGKNPAEAAQEVNRVWPHYGEVGKTVEVASKTGPLGAFGRFRAEELKAILNGTMDNPHRVAGYLAIPAMSQWLGKSIFGYSDADLQAWRDKYGYFFMPVGKDNVINAGYMGWFYDHLADWGIGARKELADDQGVFGKFWNWVEPWMEGPEASLLAAAKGIDLWKRKKVQQPWEEEDEAALKLIWGILAPAWMGGRTAKRLKNQMETGLDRFGNELNPAHTKMDAFLGLIVQEFRHDDEKRKLAMEFAYKFSQIASGMVSTNADKSVTKEEKLRRFGKMRDRLDALKTDYWDRMGAIKESEKSGE